MAEISVSSLKDSSSVSTIPTTVINASHVSIETLADMLDQQATNREYLIKLIDDLQITTSNSLKLQSTTLAQLTSSTNELTRTALVRFLLSFTIRPHSLCSYEDVGIRTVFEIESNITKNVQTNLIRRSSIHHSTTFSMFNQSSHCSLFSFSISLYSCVLGL